MRWSPRARVDAALRSGQEVTAFYDPLLGKVISHGATREAARARLVAALDDTAILGITTNLGWVRDLVASDAFRDARIDTAWLDRRAAAAGRRAAADGGPVRRGVDGRRTRAGPGRRPHDRRSVGGERRLAVGRAARPGHDRARARR